MPKIYNEQERTALTQKLLTIAGEEFRKNGFAGTSISAITKRAGIAAGTFYNFFSSKELIFFRLVEHITERRAELLSQFTEEGDPVDELKEYLLKVFEHLLQQPLMEIYHKEKMRERVMQKVPMEDLIKIQKIDTYCVEEILKRFQERGMLTEIRVEELIPHFTAIFMVFYFRDELVLPDEKQFVEQQITLFVNGLPHIG
jgi:AcrR family transcriptional regulator